MTHKVANSSNLDSLVMANEVMLPEQVFSPQLPAIGVVRLARAVLLEAIAAYQLEDCAARRAVVLWFESDSEAWPFAFRSVCNALRFDPEWFRAKLPTAKVRERRRAA